MSYCRFSSDDHQCDVYVYESCLGGYMTHVAGNRLEFKEPLPEPVPFDTHHQDAWVQRAQKMNAMVQEADRVEINLPHAGETFNHATPGECADALEHLLSLGYNVPQYVIDALREEAGVEELA